MAIRMIRTMGDPILEKQCKEVKEMTPRIRELIDDMFETMYDANGVGLAAPQVGILKRIVVIDTTGEDPIVMINPRILETSGSQTGGEGCLSVPGKTGTDRRGGLPVRARQNRHGDPPQLREGRGPQRRYAGVRNRSHGASGPGDLP